MTRSLDKPIILKRSLSHQHIHRYDLRIKVKVTKSEDEEQVAVQNTLQKFFEIVLQADKSSIIPPFLELDRSDRSIPDISASLPVAEIEPFSSVKRYFAHISQRNDKGYIYCSLILAQNKSFSEFMEIARPLLMNMDFGLFPKASDHEVSSEVGWLLYSTRSQDEERLLELISTLVKDTVGVKWRPIQVNDRFKKEAMDSNRIYALHIEAATEKAAGIRQKSATWYGSGKSVFPDGTKMRLVLPFQTILSYAHKGKYSAVLDRVHSP